MTTLSFLVADSLTGKLVGRLAPTAWEWTQPLTGQDAGKITVPLPHDAERLAQLQDIAQPQTRQVVVHDENRRWWWGGPIVSDPEVRDDQVTLTCADWRAWFYHAAIRPVDDTTRQDYIRKASNPVEQCRAIADLAAIGLDTVGAPRIVVDIPPDSTVEREVSFRMFKMTGEAMDDIARRESGPDWWTYLTADAADPTKVVAHVKVSYPERQQLTSGGLGLLLRHKVLRHEQGVGGNILTYVWPSRNVPISRVLGKGSAPAPGEEWAIAEDPGLTDGTRLAWDEVWELPDGANDPDSAFEHALARLYAHGEALGVVEVTVDPTATDLATWGPGDRVRLVVDDGWRDVDLPAVRVLSRTLRGRGGHITEVSASLNLSERDQDIDDPEATVEGEEE